MVEKETKRSACERAKGETRDLDSHRRSELLSRLSHNNGLRDSLDGVLLGVESSVELKDER